MKCFKGFIAFALILALSLLNPMLVSAEDEYVETDSYVLHHNVSDNGYEGAPFQYFGAYITDYSYDGRQTYIQNNIFSLYNTQNNSVIPVYCTDIQVAASAGSYYRRINLEDSTVAASAASLLRAIVKNGFYLEPIENESEADHNARVKAELAYIGSKVGIPDLTIGEAISATQSAIWQAAHGTRLEFLDFVRTINSNNSKNSTKYYSICDEERKNGHIVYTKDAYGNVKIDPESDVYVNTRIRAVYDYLLSLEPIPPSEKTVSPSSFSKTTTPEYTLNADGSYDIRVSTEIDVIIGENDELTLSAVVDGTSFASAKLINGKQTVILTLKGVPAESKDSPVMLAIDGYQTVDDVFLYVAKAGRDKAQSMIGADNSRLPVHTRTFAMPERVLNIYKTSLITGEDGELTRHALEGIIFDAYFVADMESYLTNSPDLPEAEDYPLPAMPTFTIVTDENGRGSMNLTHQGFADGIYLIVEREHAAIKEPVAPFYVPIPTVSLTGDYQYEITLQPKNDIAGFVQIEKDVISLGNNSASVPAGESFNWIISTNIPLDIGECKAFLITDTLDSRLDYIGNLQLSVESADGSTVLATLDQGRDYSLIVTDVDSLSDGKPSDSFLLSLTDVGAGRIAQSLSGKDYSDYKIRVRFDTQINSNALPAEEIPNQATLGYINSVNFDYSAISDSPVVYMGGINLLKVDSRDESKLLSGAQFELYREATEEEIALGVGISYLEGIEPALIKVSFYDNSLLSGNRVSVATTDENGKTAFYGLAYGKYYLYESKAPDGYKPAQTPAVIIVDGESHNAEKTVTCKNSKGSLLPETGGSGTEAFTLAGIALILLSGICLFLKMKKRA